MIFLIKTIRYFLLTGNLVAAVLIYLLVQITTKSADLAVIRLTETYALAAITCIYLALLVSPLYGLLPALPGRALAIRSRRALGVSGFFYALFHACFAFFGELGGFPGLSFLSFTYLVSISLGFLALLIVSILAVTSFDRMINRLGRTWKLIHRFIYLAGFFIIIHALLIGSHFQDFSNLIAKTYISAVFFLLFLEIVRFDKYLSERFGTKHIPLALGLAGLIFLGSYFYWPNSSRTGIGIHSDHRQNQAGQGASVSTKTFRVEPQYPEDIKPNQPTKVAFKVMDLTTNKPVNFFAKMGERSGHLIVVDEELNFFAHRHPQQVADSLEVEVNFPVEGNYYLYLNYQPLGGTEQVSKTRLQVGEPAAAANQNTDTRNTKTFGQYNVSLTTNRPLTTESISSGQQIINFTLTDLATKQPVTNLKPYLGAYGHLVMINRKNFEFLHVHPTRAINAGSTESGPTIGFSPMSLDGRVTPGLYRVFAEFNPGDKLLITDFTIEIK